MKYIDRLGCAALVLCLACWLSFLPNKAQALADSSQSAVETEQSKMLTTDELVVDLFSPRETLRTYLSGMNLIERGYPEGWYQVYPTLVDPNDPPADYDPKALMAVALDLHRTLNRVEVINFLNIPGTEELDLIRLEHPQQLPLLRYVVFPKPRHAWVWEDLGTTPDGRIVLSVDDQGNWRFTPTTIAEARQLYESVQTLPIVYGDPDIEPMGHLVTILGPTFKKTHWMSWLGLLGLIFLGLLVGKLIQVALRSAGNRLQRDKPSVRGIILHNLSGPASLLLLTIGLTIGQAMLFMDERLRQMSHGVITMLFIVVLGWLLFNLVDVLNAFLQNLADRTKSKLDDQVVPLVRKTLRIFLVIVFSLMVAQNVFGLDITGWLAGLGIVGLAVSLAAQDSVRNLFGSITILFDKPFVVGDWIVMGSLEGTVEEVGFRSTRVRTFYNSVITLPNANLINTSVDNMGKRKYRRWKTHIGVQYDTTPEKLVAFTEGIRELVRKHPYTRKDYYQVWMHQWSASSMDVLLYIFFDVPDWNTELRERERMFIDIVRLADQLGVQFAFPTQTVHLYQEEYDNPQKPYEPTHQTPQLLTDRRAMVEGIRAVRDIIQDQPWTRERPGPMAYDPETGATASSEAAAKINLTDAGDPIPEDVSEAGVAEKEETTEAQRHGEEAADPSATDSTGSGQGESKK